MATEVSYWNGNGKYQAVYNTLNDKIPASGACEDARGANRHLDKLRRAVNCYYDLFNNGLGNRAAEFRQIFGFGGTVIDTVYHYRDCEPLRRLEAAMDELIVNAANEQGVEIVTVDSFDPVI